jgi:hypothetical protein
MLEPSEKRPDTNPILTRENKEICLVYKSWRQSGASRSAISGRNTTAVKVRRNRLHLVLLGESVAEFGARSTKR